MNINYPSKISVSNGKIDIVYAETDGQMTENKIIGLARMLHGVYGSTLDVLNKKQNMPKEAFAKMVIANIQIMDDHAGKEAESAALAKRILESGISIEGDQNRIATISVKGTPEHIAACIAFIIKTIETIEQDEGSTQGEHMDKLITRIARDSTGK